MLGARSRQHTLAAFAAVGLIAVGLLSTATAASAAPTPGIVITTPLDGAAIPSTLFELAGTAPIGASLSYQILDGSDPSTTVVVADAAGAWRFDVHINRSDTGPVDVTVSGTTADNIVLAPASISVTPPPLLAAPDILTPVSGSTLPDPVVVVTGTAVPNSPIVLFVLEADRPNDIVVATARTVSGSDGSWSAELSLAAGLPFAVFAYLEDAQGGLASGNDFTEFAVASAAVPVVLPVDAPAELAATGTQTSTPGTAGALLLLLGAAGLIAGRRRGRVASAN